jgi:predicted acyltransferase
MTSLDPDFAPTTDADIVRGAATAKPERLLSIDVLRGLTIAFMILVNDQMGPAPFHQLAHADWNGFTATDLVFPTFLFVVGLTTVLSTAARLARGATRKELFLHTLRRAVLLIIFGFVVNNFPLFHMATARYYGVLPRIAICYFIVASLYLLSPDWQSKVVIAIACLIGYWALMRFVSVPGYGVPTHGIAINERDANIGAWLDRQLFSPRHLYEHTRDPEGLLSTIPAIATALFGLLTGLWLRTTRSTTRKAAMLAVVGIIFIAVALAWNPFFPISKKLWTSSFALLAGGLSMLLLSASIYIVDILRVGRPITDSDQPESATHPLLYKPLLVFGTNAILAYLISEMGDGLIRAIHLSSGMNVKNAAYHAISSAIPQPAWSSLTYSLIYVLVCWLLVLPFYRKRIFLKI